MSEKQKKYWRALLAVVLLCLLLFIWGNSLRSIPQSRAESLWVLNYLRPFLEFFVGKGNATNHLLRKIAHFAEFFLLGAGLIIWMSLKKKHGWKMVAGCLAGGLVVAALDETIQIFSHRGAQVKDVLLDFAGVLTGVMIALFAGWIIIRIGKHGRN